MFEQRQTRDLIVVVPGILGSVLYTSGERPAWDASFAMGAHVLGDFCRTLETLRLPSDIGDGPSPPPHFLEPRGLMGGWQVWPGFWAGAGYGPLVRHLRTCVGDDRQIMIFAYDWRLSNRYNARRLLRDVEPRLDEWRRNGGGADARLQLVCHSMGGLIGRYFLYVLDGQKLTRRAYTLGTPFSGSMKALKVLTGRLLPRPPERLGGRVGAINARLRDIAGTFPSVVELLPTYACVTEPGRTDDTAVKLTDRDLPDLDQHAVRHSRDFHGEILDKERPSSRGLLHVFAGHGQPTEQAVEIHGSELRFVRRQRGADYGGDGTVPWFSSVPAHWRDDADALFYPVKHVGLPRHTHLLRQLTHKITSNRPGEALKPPSPLSLDLPPVALAEQEVPLRVRADNPQMVLHAHLKDIDGTPHGRTLPLLPDGEGTYTAACRLPPGTWHVEVTTTTESPASSVEDLIVVAQC
ncbi:hypothetical protein [Streptomyces sp. NPDC021562]|uniref:esterase/lipase family protein n=1 Tax=Streptomyces sp. NPDC021562 TaxID=3155121 RepID=UPI0033C5C28B